MNLSFHARSVEILVRVPGNAQIRRGFDLEKMPGLDTIKALYFKAEDCLGF